MRLNFQVIFAFFISLSNNALATSHQSSLPCNTGFIGVVKEVSDSSAPFSSIPMVEVTFGVEDVLKGSPENDYKMKVIKNDLQPFPVGDRFEVSAQDHLACSFEKL
ncbi:MAG: hypothetical protein VXV96_18410 [Bdellovibrionota bacterium]|jgi:hypothetical protein|nr:hypothetical protein [Bdellovibrionota bacterium]